MTNAGQEPHAILELAIFAVDPNGGAQYRAAVEAAMKDLLDDPDLRVAVISLVSFSKRLDDAGHHEPAEWLLDVATSACDALRRRGEADRKLAEDLTRFKTERFRSFSDRAANKRAPRYGATAAPGTVQLKTLLPPARRLR
jgi:hypothetical protein